MSMRYPGGLIATSPVNARYPSGVWTQAQAAPYQAQNVWTRDQFWPNTTLLLQGDGAVNGAQNNTFLDSSSNNFTITRNGNTTQGSFTPYEQDGYWSNYFGGSGNYLSIADNAAFQMGSGAFTIECWFFGASFASNQCLVTKWADGQSDANAAWGLDLTSGVIRGLVASSTTVTTWTGPAPATNAWNHAAFVRDGSNNVSLFLNGNRVATATYSSSINNGANAVNVGSANGNNRVFTGYISNARVLKGTAVYDPTQTTYTVPTAPLTAITNTSLLTCQSNRFKDNSTNNFTISTSGSPSVQAFQPFPGATTYSGTVLGGSAYLDGSGDFLVTSTTTAVGTSDFTVEAWVYLTATPPSYTCVVGNDAQWFMEYGSTRGFWWGSPGANINGNYGIVLNTWVHLAVSRQSNTIRMFVNGVQTATGTDSSNFGAASVGIGNYITFTITYLPGYVTDARLVVGSAVYTSNFTPPTAPLTAITNTRLLLNMTNAGIYDNSMMNDLETVGNAQVSTSVVKYGTGSMAFDGSGDVLLTRNDGGRFSFGTGDFTVEGWCYANALGSSAATEQILFCAGSNGFTCSVYSGVLRTAKADVGTINNFTAPAVVNGSWFHFALVRNNGILSAFVNGTSVGSLSYTTDLTPSAGNASVGAYYSNILSLNGYIDDLRITKGAARYITNFTPPPARLPAQ